MSDSMPEKKFQSSIIIVLAVESRDCSALKVLQANNNNNNNN